MELKKLNETIWAIKRREHSGKFILKSTEHGGRVVNVSLSLNDGEYEVAFNMKHTEFNNFFGILSSFKELIESPEHLALNESMHEEVPILGTKEPVTKRITVSSPTPKTAKDLDLEAISATLDQIKVGGNVAKITIPDLNRPGQSSIMGTSPEPSNPVIDAPSTAQSKKKRLNKMDWDPW